MGYSSGKKERRDYYKKLVKREEEKHEMMLKDTVDECTRTLERDNLLRMEKLKRLIAAYESLKFEDSEYYDKEKHEKAKKELANLWKIMQGIHEQKSSSWGDYKKEELEKEKEEEEDNER